MDLDNFLAHAIKLERDAVTTYEQLSSSLTEQFSRDVIVFFEEMAHYARLHLGEIRKHVGPQFVEADAAKRYIGESSTGPESIVIPEQAIDTCDLERVMSLAHEAESRAARFYAEIARIATDQKVTTLARQFAAEEQQHILALERFMGLKPY